MNLKLKSFLFAISILMPFESMSNENDNALIQLVPSGTRVLIRIDQNVSSRRSKTSEAIAASVSSDVKVNDVVVIKAGSRCIASVTQRKESWYVGQPGSIQINIQYVQAVDGTLIPVTGAIASNEGRNKQTESLIIGYVLCFFFYLMRGEEGEIPIGSNIEGYTAGSMNIKVKR